MNNFQLGVVASSLRSAGAAIPAPLSSARWAIYITATGAVNNCSFKEVRMYDETDTLISYSGASFSATSQFSGSYIPAYAGDANTSTRWAAAGVSVPHRWWVTYSGSKTVTRIEIHCDTTVNSPTAFQVQRDTDGGPTWSTVSSHTATWTNGETKSFDVQ